MMDSVELSVVVPVYRCEGALRELHRRLTESLEWTDGSYEIVLIEDRGPDGSWEVLDELASIDPHVRAFRLSRNFGQHAAITAGLSRSRGRWVVVMDCDLQDPPEEIRRLYAKASEGYEVVLARRTKKRASLFRRLASSTYFALMNFFTGTSIDPGHGSFSIISRKVVDAFLAVKDRDRHYLFVLYWLGFDRASIEYEHAARTDGKSSYTLTRLIAHAFQGMFFQTTVLLRWVIYSGLVLAFVGACAAVYFVVARVRGVVYPGWTSLVVLQLLIGGLVVISTGVAGLYIGRIFDEVRERPLFVIDEASDEELEAEATRTEREHVRSDGGL
jgi:polyisoprenyl-phosphate glycosyltransferase